ncbi:MAG: YicC family protein [Magnetococcales bacterium]|nr:YicC family protein [Magnetococcales bacterium]
MSGTVESMTGFARLERQAEDVRIIWRLKSVNHRFLDLSLRMPESCAGLELSVAGHLKKSMGRGRVEGTLNLVNDAQQTRLELDPERLKALLEVESRAAELVSQQSGQRDAISLKALLAWPGVVLERREGQDEIVPDSDLGREVLSLLQEVAARLTETRLREGAALVEIMSALLDRLADFREKVVTYIPVVRETMATRLQERIAELTAERTVDEGRFAQEMAFLLNKSDIGEELDRLQVHIAEMRSVLVNGGEVGRRLDFLCQELNREVNTIGSKSQEADLSSLVVEMKVIVEKLREQCQNLA